MNASLVGWTDSDGRVEAVIEESASIGAARDNAVVVRTDGVSGHHARIMRQDGKYFVEDTGSRNGTWVNGERVTRARLQHLDVVTLGRFADLVFLDRAISEARVPVRDAEPVETPASDLEWRTRLVWSPEELQNLRAAGLNAPTSAKASTSAKATADKTAEKPTAKSAPAGKPIEKPAPPPAAAKPTPAAAPEPAKPVEPPAPSPDRTVFLPGGLTSAPPAFSTSDEVPEGERTQLRAPDSASFPIMAPPPSELLNPEERTQFRPTGFGSEAGLSPPSGMFKEDGTQLASPSSGIASAPPPALEAESEPAASDEPPPTTLPSGSILGFRDVGPPPSSASMNDVTVLPTGRIDTPGTTAARSNKPIRAMRLTGDFGEYDLPVGVSTVGRSSEATIRIDSREMSRIHATITVSPEFVTVEDGGSANGTSVNGAMIEGLRRLIDGDRLAFANYEFRVELLRLEGDR